MSSETVIYINSTIIFASIVDCMFLLYVISNLLFKKRSHVHLPLVIITGLASGISLGLYLIEYHFPKKFNNLSALNVYTDGL